MVDRPAELVSAELVLVKVELVDEVVRVADAVEFPDEVAVTDAVVAVEVMLPVLVVEGAVVL